MGLEPAHSDASNVPRLRSSVAAGGDDLRTSSGPAAQMQFVLSLQRTIGNRAVFDLLQRRMHPVQRRIDVNGTVYDKADQAQAVINEIKREVPDGWENPLGSTLAKMLSNKTVTYGPYADYGALLRDLKARRAAGTSAQEKGKERERNVAVSSGGKIADEGRYGQDVTVHLDPTSHRHVKLDTQGDTYYGIVGGPAKAANLDKFVAICRDLKVISEAHHKQPRVYCTRDTPAEVVEAAEAVVGVSNVYEVESGHVWGVNPYAFDMPAYGAKVEKDRRSGLPEGAMPYIT